MAKLTLAPQDIQALLKTDPVVEVEIIDKAAQQVADALNRKVTRELVEKRVGELMEKLLVEQVGWNQRKLAPNLQQLVEKSARDAAETAFATSEGRRIALAISTEASAQMRDIGKKLASEMKSEVRNIVREELRELLGKV